jgi:acetolactate synthase-1/2/3 large subunit
MLKNPDFAALARAYGFHGETVEATGEFRSAFERAQDAKTSALIEVRVDPDAISPRATLSSIRAEALKNKTR